MIFIRLGDGFLLLDDDLLNDLLLRLLRDLLPSQAFDLRDLCWLDENSGRCDLGRHLGSISVPSPNNLLDNLLFDNFLDLHAYFLDASKQVPFLHRNRLLRLRNCVEMKGLRLERESVAVCRLFCVVERLIELEVAWARELRVEMRLLALAEVHVDSWVIVIDHAYCRPRVS